MKKKTKTVTFESPQHHELELKFELTGLGYPVTSIFSNLFRDFQGAVQGFKRVSSPDTYYRQGDNVLRYRAHPSGQGGEMTVKLRTSRSSIANRVEVDLPLGGNVSDPDVYAFLAGTGWEQELTLVKHSIIMHLGPAQPWQRGDQSPPVIIAAYTVEPGKLHPDLELTDECLKPRTFLEVELDKDHHFDMERAQVHLKRWHGYFQRMVLQFPDEPLNKSLYELYTRRFYQMAKEKMR